MCYLERGSGWIVVVPVRRLAASPREIEAATVRHAGPRWGGDA
ncbi:hypothetical protein [Actinomadura roseirufa]|nr:hypothetical protein [Actinomadura roseirufa]